MQWFEHESCLLLCFWCCTIAWGLEKGRKEIACICGLLGGWGKQDKWEWNASLLLKYHSVLNSILLVYQEWLRKDMQKVFVCAQHEQVCRVPERSKCSSFFLMFFWTLQSLKKLVPVPTWIMHMSNVSPQMNTAHCIKANDPLKRKNHLER